MPDALGYRAKLGVLVPSTNTIVEPDFYSMAPPGVTIHTARIFVPSARMDDDASFEKLIEQVGAATSRAIADVVTCEPDYLVLGMSSESFWNGREGNAALQRRVQSVCGLRLATGASAIERALTVLRVHRLSILSPYQPIADARMRTFIESCGHEVVAMKSLRCASAVGIAHVDEPTLRRALIELDGPDVDAIVQMGTNLSMLRFADEAERWLGKPVISINAATFWYALREIGISDRRAGFGSLLRDF
jgi:maleate isomerase